MDWLFKHLFQLVTIIVVIVSIVRSISQAREAQTRHKDETVDAEEQRRTREIQENIRRKIAERRGGQPTAMDGDTVARSELPPRTVRPSPEATTPPTGPLGEFGRRVFEEFERKIQPPELPRVPHSNRAELERQEQLAEELRVAQEAKADAMRRAAHLAQDRRAATQTETALRTVARAQLLGELRDPQSLRRAFVLREVLGTPVGLR